LFARRATARGTRCGAPARVPWHIACTNIPAKPVSLLTAEQSGHSLL
jgi:hypothetical protein